MSYRPSGLPSHLRHPSIVSSSSSTSQSSALQHRINEKRAELDNLKQLRDLSAGLAGQMEQLEDKLSTLSDGTEGMEMSVYSCDMAFAYVVYSRRNSPVQLAYRPQSNSYGLRYARILSVSRRYLHQLMTLSASTNPST